VGGREGKVRREEARRRVARHAFPCLPCRTIRARGPGYANNKPSAACKTENLGGGRVWCTHDHPISVRLRGEAYEHPSLG
jgi:hypothetical protein